MNFWDLLIVIILLAWLSGWKLFAITSELLNLLIVVAVVILVIRIIQGFLRRPPSNPPGPLV